MINKVDHIGIAVKDLTEALRFYEETLGLKHIDIEVVEDQGVKVAMLPVGEVRIELLQPIRDNSPVAKFIESRGEGIHHIAMDVDDVQAQLNAVAEKGLALIDKQPRDGAHSKMIAFLHPKSTRGVLLELCQDKAKGKH